MSSATEEDDGRIVVSHEGRVTLISVDRVKKRNGFTPKMLRELSRALTEFDNDDASFCAVLYAEGAHFSAGLDLAKVAAAWDRGESIYATDALDIYDLRPPYRRKPLVMAVQGITFTLSVEMMLAADIVIAAEDCRFAVLEVTRGIMASGGATIRLAQRMGWSGAMRYLLTGDEFDAATALQFGIVQEVVAAGSQLPRAKDIARQIAEKAAPLAVIATRQNARAAIEQGSLVAVSQFDAIRSKLRTTDDAKEGVRSFVEKRPPRFTGR